MFRTTDGGRNWQELPDSAATGRGPIGRQAPVDVPDTILLDPNVPGRIFIAISAAGAFVPMMLARRGGRSIRDCTPSLCQSDCRGGPLRSSHRHAQVAPGCALHAKALGRDAHRQRRDSWREVSGNLPTDFGFVIDVHGARAGDIYVVPIKSDGEHYPPEGRYVCTAAGRWQRVGGAHQRPATERLLRDVLRDAMAIDSLDSCGVYFGTPADRSTHRRMPATMGAHCPGFPAVLSVEVQTLA